MLPYPAMSLARTTLTTEEQALRCLSYGPARAYTPIREPYMWTTTHVFHAVHRLVMIALTILLVHSCASWLSGITSYGWTRVLFDACVYGLYHVADYAVENEQVHRVKFDVHQTILDNAIQTDESWRHVRRLYTLIKASKHGGTLYLSLPQHMCCGLLVDAIEITIGSERITVANSIAADPRGRVILRTSWGADNEVVDRVPPYYVNAAGGALDPAPPCM